MRRRRYRPVAGESRYSFRPTLPWTVVRQDRTGIGSGVVGVDDDAIRTLLTRLGRASGGTIIERAAVVAAGADSDAVMTWILAHGGKPQAAAETSTRHGLHDSRLHTSGSEPRGRSRFVLPASALD